MSALLLATLLNLTPLQAVEEFPEIVIEGVAAAPSAQPPRPAGRVWEGLGDGSIPVRTDFRLRMLSSALRL